MNKEYDCKCSICGAECVSDEEVNDKDIKICEDCIKMIIEYAKDKE